MSTFWRAQITMRHHQAPALAVRGSRKKTRVRIRIYEVGSWLGLVDSNSRSSLLVPISRVRKIFYGSEYASRMSQQSGIKAKKPPNSPYHSAAKFGLLIENDEQQQEEISLIGSDEGMLAPWVEALNCLLDPKASIHLLFTIANNVKSKFQAALETPELKAEVRLKQNNPVLTVLCVCQVNSLLKLEVRVRLLDVPPGCWNLEVRTPEYPKDLSWIPEHRNTGG